MNTNADPNDGFTLVELVVVMMISGVLMAVAAFGFSNYRNMSEQKGSAQELMSTLRAASEQAISEGRTYCVDLTNAASGNRTYSTWRKACSTATGTQTGGTRQTQSSRVTFSTTVTNPATPPACPSGHACVYFYPRGTALPTTITVASSARSSTYTIHVEGLTARVYI